MAQENKPQFKNIVLQDADGTVHMFEPKAEGLSVILLVLKEEENSMAQISIRSAFTLRAGATLIHEFMKDNPDLGPALMAVSMAEIIETIKSHGGGPPNETIQ